MTDIRTVLARQTRPLHDAVDAYAASLNVDVPAGRDALLAMMAQGFGAAEAGLENAQVHQCLPEWDSRRRAHLITLPKPREIKHTPQRLVVLVGVGEVWGALYVLEGARLGARYLARAHPSLAAHPFFGTEATPFWPRFVARLRQADRELSDRPAMVRGAEKTFAAFL